MLWSHKIQYKQSLNTRDRARKLRKIAVKQHLLRSHKLHEQVQGATNFSEIYVPVTNTRSTQSGNRNCRQRISALEPQTHCNKQV